jgi:hypothetical protein
VGATVFFQSSSELATLTNTFKAGSPLVPTDPTTISLTVTTPAQVPTTYTHAGGTITKSSTGVYTKDIACTEDGTWTYEWTGTGAASDIVAGTWEVHETALGKLYAPVEALKSRLGMASTDTADDFELHAACFAASRSLEQYCEGHFWRTATGTVRTFVPCGLYELRLPEFNDLVSVTTLKTDAAGDGTFETTWASTDYQLLPQNPAAAPEQKPYTKIRAIGAQTFPTTYVALARDDRVEITGVYGWPTVPYGIKQAALILAAETFKLKDAPGGGVAGFGEFGVIRIRQNPMVAQFADPYRRNAVLVA